MRRASTDKRRSEHEYRAALLAAVQWLEHEGAKDPYAQVAHAAGIARQSARVIVGRAR